MRSAVHHIELWTESLQQSGPGFQWLFTTLGWEAERVEGWELGRIWKARSGEYVVLEESDDVAGPYNRLRAGLNHLALCVPSRALLEEMRVQAPASGWTELFADRYPHAGGSDHTALYLENAQGFEIELVLTEV